MFGRFTLYVFMILIINFAVLKSETSEGPSDKQSFGIMAAFLSKQADLMFPICIGEAMHVIPFVGVTYYKESNSELNIGLSVKVYLRNKTVSPYLKFSLAKLLEFSYFKKTVTDDEIGIGVGGEYFLNSFFSIGVEGQLNIIQSDKNSTYFQNPGKLNINTATMIFATVYF